MHSKLNFEDRVLVDTATVVAWDKPPGLASTGRDLDDPDCAQFFAIEHHGSMVWALHQLDRDTSGVLLFTRKKRQVARWQERWNSGAVEKYYAAVVHGRLPRAHLRIEAPLLPHRRQGFTEVLVDDAGKPAATVVWELSAARSYSLVLARAVTGRTHQIRVHLQHLGTPLVGEKRYNAIPCAHHPRHALHALALLSDEPAPLDCIEAPLPEDLQRLLSKLDIDGSPLTQWRDIIDAS